MGVCWEKRKNKSTGYLSCCRGDFERQKGEFGNARTWLESALEAAEDAYIPGWIGNAYLGLAELALDEGRLKDANDLLDRARAHFEPTSNLWGMLHFSIGTARALQIEGKSQWIEIAKIARTQALQAGYQRDATFVNQIIGTAVGKQCLMFL
jgi:tetratricopeptide (TPR) repeat protein